MSRNHTTREIILENRKNIWPGRWLGSYILLRRVLTCRSLLPSSGGKADLQAKVKCKSVPQYNFSFYNVLFNVLCIMKTHESAQIMTPNLKKKDMSSYANSENNFRRFTDAQSLNHELLSYSLMIFLIGIMKKKITCEEIKKTEKKKPAKHTHTHTHQLQV